MSQSVFAIGNFSVRQICGLFSLNDLHAAAGGEAKHQPAKFTTLESTKALVAEIGNSPDSESLKITTGRTGGTYACRELVIAYAAWISAAFHLKVIRVFLGQQEIAPCALPMQDKTDAAIEAANAVAAQVHSAVFKAVMAGNDWKHKRWMVSFITDSKHGAPVMVDTVDSDAVVMSLAYLANAIVEPGGMMPTNSELANLASACTQRLAHRMQPAKATV